MTQLDFKTFIDTQIGANQEDLVSNQVIVLIKEDKDFPKTYDIKVMAQYIYKRLNVQQTTAYQKLLFFWLFRNNNNQPPTDPTFINDINYVVDLQRGE